MGWPGDTTEEKMKGTIFTLEEGLMQQEDKNNVYPKIVKEAFQVIECTWVDTLDNAQDDKAGCLDGYEGPYHDFNGTTSKFGAHFILKIDKILMTTPENSTIEL